mgnify:FL=1
MSAPVIPKTCKAAVVRNPGPDYTIECIDVSGHVASQTFELT